ncbi:MAG: biotin-dependent carboxyltransferase family protein [Pseudomonadota bacterium]
MTAYLKILQPGAHTTVQDLGRIGYLGIGVPPSGALDPVSLRLSNHAVGNNEGEGALEIAYIGPEFLVEADSIRVCVVGEGSSIRVRSPEPLTIPEGRSVRLPRGSVGQVVIAKGTAIAYLAIEGGLAIPSLMGSLSTYVRGGFGGFQGRALKEGDLLPLTLEDAPARPEGGYEALPNAVPQNDASGAVSVRAVLGPQDDFFTAKGIETFLSASFSFSKASDRMGARLDGPSLEVRDFENFVSDGITAGAVQVPGSGQPIVLLADHQTSGGYPKIATVLSADLPIFGRIKPGMKIRFKAVGVEEAVRIVRAQEASIQKAMQSFSPVTDAGKLNVDALLNDNIVSGVFGVEDN